LTATIGVPSGPFALAKDSMPQVSQNRCWIFCVWKRYSVSASSPLVRVKTLAGEKARIEPRRWQ